MIHELNVSFAFMTESRAWDRCMSFSKSVLPIKLIIKNRICYWDVSLREVERQLFIHSLIEAVGTMENSKGLKSNRPSFASLGASWHYLTSKLQIFSLVK